MSTHPDTERPPVGVPPRWLLPALVGALLAVAGVLALVLTNGLAPAAQAPVAVAPTAQAPAPAPAPASAPDAAAQAPPDAHSGIDPNGPKIEQIAVADARARFDAGSAIFIDMRAGSDYAAGHIPGALTITSRDLETRLQTLPEGAVIIAYGDATRPDSGQRGAQIFMELGYPTVIAMEGGFQDWQAAGHPVDGGL